MKCRIMTYTMCVKVFFFNVIQNNGEVCGGALANKCLPRGGGVVSASRERMGITDLIY